MRNSVLLLALATTFVTAHETRAQENEGNNLLAPWQTIGDTTLVRLTSQALIANKDVQSAKAAVRGARLTKRLVSFDFAPTATANFGLVRRRLSATQLPGVPNANRDADVYDSGIDASWEIDIFGRTRNTYRAQGAVERAVGEDLRDVQLSLTAEVARTYFELRGAESQLAVATENVRNQQRSLQITTDRLSAGRGTAFDRERASAQVSATLADVASTEAQLAAAKYRLGVLIGEDPNVTPLPPLTGEDLDIEEVPVRKLPATPEFTTVQQFVSRRPDVRGANDRVQASEATVDAARADYLPRLSIVGSVGYNTANTSTFGMRESSRYAVGPVVSWSAFNIGRVHTRSEVARASVDQAKASRDQTVRAAEGEVKAAIASYDRALLRVKLLRDAASSSERGANLAKLRYDGGESGFLEVLDAQRTLLSAQERLVRGETDAANAYVALYKALGGVWTGNN